MWRSKSPSPVMWSSAQTPSWCWTAKYWASPTMKPTPWPCSLLYPVENTTFIPAWGGGRGGGRRGGGGGGQRLWGHHPPTDGRALVQVEDTAVWFRNASEGELRRYIATGEPMDKAGAYGIQGRGGLLVSRIQGDYTNVVGLPIVRLASMLAQFGVTVL